MMDWYRNSLAALHARATGNPPTPCLMRRAWITALGDTNGVRPCQPGLLPLAHAAYMTAKAGLAQILLERA